MRQSMASSDKKLKHSLERALQDCSEKGACLPWNQENKAVTGIGAGPKGEKLEEAKASLISPFREQEPFPY